MSPPSSSTGSKGYGNSAFARFRQRMRGSSTASSGAEKTPSSTTTAGSGPQTSAENERSSFEGEERDDSDVEEIPRTRSPGVDGRRQTPSGAPTYGFSMPGIEIGRMAPGSNAFVHTSAGTKNFRVPGQQPHDPWQSGQGGPQSGPAGPSANNNVNVTFGGNNGGVQMKTLTGDLQFGPSQGQGPMTFKINGVEYTAEEWNRKMQEETQ